MAQSFFVLRIIGQCSFLPFIILNFDPFDKRISHIPLHNLTGCLRVALIVNTLAEMHINVKTKVTLVSL